MFTYALNNIKQRRVCVGGGVFSLMNMNIAKSYITEFIL